MNKERLAQLAADGRDKIRRAATTAGSGTVILSGEGAYRYLSIKDLSALKTFVEDIFDDVKVVAYVREPFGLISSVFHNDVMGHRLSSLKFRYTRYDRLKKLDEVFGRERVNLWKYDRSGFPKGDVVRHFSEMTGLPTMSSSEANVTGSRPAVSAVYRLNRTNVGDEQAKDHKQIVNLIRYSFPHDQWPKFHLSPHLVRPAIEAKARDLDWIEERIGSSFRDEPEERESDVREEKDLLMVEPQVRTQLLKLAESLTEDAACLLEVALAS